MSKLVVVLFALALGAPCSSAATLSYEPHFYNVTLTASKTNNNVLVGFMNFCMKTIGDTNAVTMNWGLPLSPLVTALKVSDFVLTEQSDLNPGTVATSVPITSVTPDASRNTITLNTDTIPANLFINFTFTFTTSCNYMANKGCSTRSFINTDNTTSIFIFATSWTREARNIFPCIDDITYTAGMNLTIIRPSDWKTDSSLPWRSTVAGADSGTMVDTYNTTEAFPLAKLAFFLTSDMSKTVYPQPSTSPTAITFWSKKGYTGTALNNVINVLAQYFYAFESVLSTTLSNSGGMRIILVPNLEWPVSGSGLMFIRDENYAQSYTSAQSEGLFKFSVIPVLNEMISQFSLYDTTPKAWSDSWIFKAINSFILTSTLNSNGCPFDIATDTEVVARQTALYLDTLATSKPLEDTDMNSMSPAAVDFVLRSQLFNTKAPALFLALDQYLPAGIILSTTKTLLNANKKKTVSSDDFYALLVSNVASSGAYISPSLTASASSVNLWLRSTAYPLLTVDNVRAGNPGLIDLSLTPFPSTKTLGAVFVLTTVTSKSDDTQYTPRQGIWVSTSATATGYITVATGDWVAANTRSYGYYRTNYTGSNWQSILTALSDNAADIVSRTNIIDDLFAFARVGLHDWNQAIRFCTVNMNETKSRNWYPVFQNLRRIGDSFRGLSIYSGFKDFIVPFLRIVNTLLDSGSLDQFEHARILALAYRWLCEFDVGGYRKAATNNFASMLKGELPTSMPSSTYDAMACCAAKYSTSYNAQAMWSNVSASSNSYYIKRRNAFGIACLADYAPISNLLDTMLTADKSLSPYVMMIFDILAVEHPSELTANISTMASKFQKQIDSVPLAAIIEKASRYMNTVEQANTLNGIVSADVDDVVKQAATNAIASINAQVAFLKTYNVSILNALESNRLGPVTPSSADTTATLVSAVLVPIFLVMLATV